MSVTTVSIQIVDCCVLLQFRNLSTGSGGDDEIESFINRLSEYFQQRLFRAASWLDFVDSSQLNFTDFQIDSSVDRFLSRLSPAPTQLLKCFTTTTTEQPQSPAASSTVTQKSTKSKSKSKSSSSSSSSTTTISPPQQQQPLTASSVLRRKRSDFSNIYESFAMALAKGILPSNSNVEEIFGADVDLETLFLAFDAVFVRRLTERQRLNFDGSITIQLNTELKLDADFVEQLNINVVRFSGGRSAISSTSKSNSAWSTSSLQYSLAASSIIASTTPYTTSTKHQSRNDNKKKQQQASNSSTQTPISTTSTPSSSTSSSNNTTNNSNNSNTGNPVQYLESAELILVEIRDGPTGRHRPATRLVATIEITPALFGLGQSVLQAATLERAATDEQSSNSTTTTTTPPPASPIKQSSSSNNNNNSEFDKKKKSSCAVQ